MASNVTDTEHIKKIPLDPLGAWMEVDVRRSQDPEATTFHSPYVDPKPVMYMPVKRRQGVDTFPQLVIHIQILEEDQRFMVQVPAWTGATINVKVRNVWAGVLGVHETPLTGTLSKSLECFLRVPADTVKQWLNPDGPLKGRINENLLEFSYEIPSISKDGVPLQGFSTNRIYLYRRKTIVFLPGLFASEFAVKIGKGRVAAFPNFFVEKDGEGLLGGMLLDIGQFEIMLGEAIVSGQHVGLLECDSQGEPLLRADKPMLLRVGIIPGVQVEDFYNKCHDAVHDRMLFKFNSFPDRFRLFELQMFCYDWRGDLTQTVGDLLNNPQEPKRSLKHLQQNLQRLPDTDDQVAIMGHSTGGVLIRRLLGESAASSVISHAFFVDAPLRGAPKALGVALTGCDPPGGGPMIPFIDAKSMVSIAVTEPIVYHLSPSAKFPTPVISTPDFPKGCGDREKEKASLVDSAADRGMYSPRYVVDPAKASNRTRLGAFADQWADYWDRLADWRHARAAYRKAFNETAFAQLEAKQLDPLMSDPILKEEYDSRVPQKWSPYLAGRAQAFHEASEQVAASGAWASKAYLFYATGNVTTQAIKIELIRQESCDDVAKTFFELADGTARPSHKNRSGDGSQWVEYEQWVVENNKMYKRFWKLSADQDNQGDGTVPLCSQIGFGGPINVFKALPGNPKHVPAPDSEWLWSRVIEVLSGYDVTEYLDKNVDPIQGVIKKS